MRKQAITRKIVITTVHLVEGRFHDGAIQQVDLPPMIIIGKVTPEKIDRQVRKTYGLRQVHVTHTETVTRFYEMTLDYFIQNATVKQELKG